MQALEPRADAPPHPDGRATAPHTPPIGELLERLGVDAERGLDAPRVAELREEYGPNQLAEAPPVSRWRRFLGQFREPVIVILIVAAVIAGAMGEWVDTLAILAIVLLNGLLGFLQEERAGQALAALRKLSAPLAKVLRGGVLQSVPARELVPGDRVELEAGDHIPADVRLLRAFGFRVAGGRPHRRVGPRGEGPRRRPGRGHAAGRPAEHGLHGHGGRRRQGRRRRRRHRHGHRAGPDRRDAPAVRAGADAAAAAARRAGQGPARRLPGRRGRHLPAPVAPRATTSSRPSCCR